MELENHKTVWGIEGLGKISVGRGAIAESDVQCAGTRELYGAQLPAPQLADNGLVDFCIGEVLSGVELGDVQPRAGSTFPAGSRMETWHDRAATPTTYRPFQGEGAAT